MLNFFKKLLGITPPAPVAEPVVPYKLESAPVPATSPPALAPWQESDTAGQWPFPTSAKPAEGAAVPVLTEKVTPVKAKATAKKPAVPKKVTAITEKVATVTKTKKPKAAK